MYGREQGGRKDCCADIEHVEHVQVHMLEGGEDVLHLHLKHKAAFYLGHRSLYRQAPDAVD